MFQESKTRFYIVAGGKVQIKDEQARKLIESNKKTNISIFDKHFIRLLVAIFVGLKNIQKGQIAEDIYNLIKRMFHIFQSFDSLMILLQIEFTCFIFNSDIFGVRVSDDSSRMDKFDELVEAYFMEKSGKFEVLKNQPHSSE